MIGRAAAVAVLLALVVAPFVPMGGMRQYVLHVVIQIFIWSFIGGAWSLMGRFGLVSLGHGAFLGVGAYTTTLLWNFYGLTPWLGTFVAMAAAVVLALIVAYPCSRDRKSTRLNSSHSQISYAVFCLKKKQSLLCMSLCSGPRGPIRTLWLESFP